MPIDPSIALQGKPVDIPPVDFNQTFRTLSQMRYMAANTQKVQEEAARAQQLFEEEGAFHQRLSSLGKGAVPPQDLMPLQPQPATPTGGPPYDTATLAALPQGGSTPPPGTPLDGAPGQAVDAGPGQASAGAPAPGAPAPRRRSIFDADVQDELHQLAPHVAGKLIDEHQKMALATLEAHQKLYENAARGLHPGMDARAYEAWRLAASTTLPPDVASRLPTTWTPDLVPKLIANAQSLTTTFDQHIAAGKQANETTNAQTQRMLAETGQTAEQRQGREVVPITGPEGVRLVERFPQPGSSPAGPLPGTAPAMAPGAAAAAGSEKQALAAHDSLKGIESSPANLTGLWQTGISAIPGLGSHLTPSANLQYKQGKAQFMTAIGGGDESQYFVQPGDIGLFKGPSDPAYQRLLAQKQAARDAAIQKLRIQTNRPQGLTPPGQTRMTSGNGTAAGTPHPPQVYTRAQVSTLAARHGMTEAAVEALIKADGDRIAP